MPTPSRRIIEHPDQGKEFAEPMRPYLEAIEQSSERTRWLTIVITVATIVSFFAYWNTLGFSWMHSRLVLARDARTFLLSRPAEKSAWLMGKTRDRYQRAQDFLIELDLLRAYPDSVDHGGEFFDIPIVVRDFTFRSLAADKSATEERPGISSLHTEMALKSSSSTGRSELVQGTAHVLIDLRTIEINRIVAELEEAELRSVKVLNVPFLGIDFDVNDLGLMSGIAFLCLMIMRKLSLSNELASLKAVVRRGYLTGCLRPTYELVSMRQVLTIPVRTMRDVNRPYFWLRMWSLRVVPMLIDVAPLVLLAFIIHNNYVTFPIGKMINVDNAKLSIAASLALSAILLILTLWCLLSEIRLHKTLDSVVLDDEAAFRNTFDCDEGSEGGPSAASPE